MRIASFALPALLALCSLARGADAPVSASELAAQVRSQRLSDGFQVRLRTVTIDAEGRRGETDRLALIGQFGPERLRLLVRGIAPSALQGRSVAAQMQADGRVRVFGQDGSAPVADPYMKLFGSELVVWDLLAPWWSWPQQSIEGTQTLLGRQCTVLRSRSSALDSPIAEVVSCVVSDGELSLRTELFDERHALVRRILVTQTARRESGALAARQFMVSGVGGRTTEVQVYSADERYFIDADVFSLLNSGPASSH